MLLDPSATPDAEIGRQFGYLKTFGRGMFPLVMRLYREHLHGALGVDELVGALEHLQSLLLRRTIVGVTTDTSRGSALPARMTGATRSSARSRGSRRLMSASASG